MDLQANVEDSCSQNTKETTWSQCARELGGIYCTMMWKKRIIKKPALDLKKYHETIDVNLNMIDDGMWE